MANTRIARCMHLGRILVDNSNITKQNKFQCYKFKSTLFRIFSSSTEANTEKSNEPEDVSIFKTEIEKLTLKLKETSDKCEVLDDKYKRALAEGENMRLRLTKQIEDAKIFSIQGFCKDLLEVSDILQRATESVPKDEVSEKNPHLKSLYEGLSMTEAQLQSVFRRHGLTAVNPIGEKFNPNYHEALFQQEVEGKEAGTVVVVSKTGYKLQERVIRPALVGVAKGS